MEAKTLALLSLVVTGIVIALIVWVVWRIFFRQSVVSEEVGVIKGWEIIKNILTSSTTLLLIIAVSIPMAYFVTFILGFPKLEPEETITTWKIIQAPWEVISELEIGKYVVIFVLGLAGIIAINVIKLKLINWELAKKFLIVATIITAFYAVVISIFPDFSPRAKLKSICEAPSPAPNAQPQLQITPQISYGWKVDNNGNLVANLKSGEKATRPFHLARHQSTPIIIIPPDNYRFRFTNLQTVIVDDGYKKTIVHPKDYYDMGIVTGWRKLMFTALEGGAELILYIERL